MRMGYNLTIARFNSGTNDEETVQRSSKSENNLAQKYFSKIDKITFNKLVNVYRNDLLLFNYAITPYVYYVKEPI